MKWWRDFKMDVARWVDEPLIGDPEELSFRDIMRLSFRRVPLRVMFWFRLGQGAKRKGVKAVPAWCQRRLLRKYGFEILINSSIKGGLYVPHPVGTVISPARMGENCSVISNVTVGMGDRGEFPRIGDRVFLGAGCRVLGAITLGDDAKVGANAVVVRDVDVDTTVVGIPAKPVASRDD